MVKVPRNPMGTPQRCIFCDGDNASPMSAEHLWPAWMASYFPRTAHDVRIESHVRGPHQSLPFGFPPGKQYHGHNTTKKLKVVCRFCNNGWMSKIEQEAKETIKNLMEARIFELDHRAQNSVVEWAALKVFISEHNRPNDAVNLTETRRKFYNERLLPPRMQIFLLRCNDDRWRSTFRRHTVNVVPKPNVPERGGPPNTQCITIGIIELIIFIYQSNTIDASIEFKDEFARQIHPIKNKTVSWPPKSILDGVGIEAVANSLAQLVSQSEIFP
jgi:hypothetical protein